MKTYIIEECISRLQNSMEFDDHIAIKSLVENRQLDDRINELCRALSDQNPASRNCDSLRLHGELALWKASLSVTPCNETVRSKH